MSALLLGSASSTALAWRHILGARPRDIQRGANAVGGLVWLVSFQALREFVWSDLRQGMIRLDGLSLPARVLACTAFLSVFAVAASTLVADFWRTSFELASVPVSQGLYLPVPLIPVTLLLLSFAWSLVLTGALHSPVPVRLAVLVLFLIPAMGWSDLGTRAYTPWLLNTATWGSLFAVPLVFLARWRAGPRPALEFGVLFALITTAYASVNSTAVDAWRLLGDASPLRSFWFHVIWLALSIAPLVYYLGVDLADSMLHLSQWAAMGLGRARGLLVPTLFIAIFLRLNEVVRELVAGARATTVADMLQGLLGALVLPACLVLTSWTFLRARRVAIQPAQIASDISRAAIRGAPLLVLAYEANRLLAYVMSGFLVAVPTFLPFGMSIDHPLILSGVDAVQDAEKTWYGIVAVAALSMALWLAWRGHIAPALYLVAFGMREGWMQIFEVPAVRRFAWTDYSSLDLWWVLLILGTALTLWRAGRLTNEWAGRLVFLVVITELIRRVDIIEEPLGPFFAGIGLLVLGILWDMVTAGTWANGSSIRFPRASRIFLYLGYMLLSITVIHWMVITRFRYQIDFITQSGVIQGFERFGMPLLNVIMAVTLVQAFQHARVRSNGP